MATIKNYIAPKDKVLLTDQKLTGTNTWANYTSDDAGKMPKIVETSTGSGVYELRLGTVVEQLHYVKYASRSDLPTAGASVAQIIALVPMSTTETDNAYEEYICVQTSTSPDTWAWELLGSLKPSITQADDKITINGTEIQFASYDATTSPATAKCGIVSGADYNKIANAVQKDSASAKTFTIGCDANGPYVQWDDA